MVNYSCKRCGFNTNIRTKNYDHLRKKNTCKTLLSEVSIEYLKQELDVYIASKNKIEIDPKSYSLLPHNLLTNPSQIYSQNIQNGTMSSFNGTMSSSNGTMSSSRKDTLPSKYKCHNCNAIFSRKDN